MRSSLTCDLGHEKCERDGDGDDQPLLCAKAEGHLGQCVRWSGKDARRKARNEMGTKNALRISESKHNLSRRLLHNAMQYDVDIERNKKGRQANHREQNIKQVLDKS